jgi:hypothetical protein
MYFFLKPVKFGVWYIRISTLSGPNSDTKGARREAHDGFGDSRVPLNASVRMLSFNLGLALRACWRVEIWTQSMRAQCRGAGRNTSSCSVFPMYKVERNILFSALKILAYFHQLISIHNVSYSEPSASRRIPSVIAISVSVTHVSRISELSYPAHS